MITRKIQEEFEIKYLSQFASKSKFAKREIEEEKDYFRTSYQRDRDRIIHSKSFRRLKHKTQVYISPEKDHYRTRLTHTLEVAQIARTISRALGLNEDLTEAIALGHDLGHTPFGHMGEDALSVLNPKGFKHYEQSARIVKFLEISKGKPGLNLTMDVVDGIENHTGENRANTLEGKVIKFADRIAYINHDIDDSIRAGILSEENLPNDIRETFGNSPSERINSMVVNVINASMDSNDIQMGKEEYKLMLELRKFMFQEVYFNPIVKADEDKAKEIIERLYLYYLKNIDKLPTEHLKIYRMSDKLQESTKEDIVTDYIAGMTDTFAIHEYKEIFIPKQWHI
ncbi:deoxyguanosinetriphosphate triphosphohydrolase [Lagierella sp.]|uniref:deoxyguanosinetriphosphate triphosphohydrolase n=1 Tax=Lagierella sp. TaxID=2849657 RepID=UPI00260719D5|nr:deoxyguanosinetriphosphate triphosphohydrolase [Lagierella sp.]